MPTILLIEDDKTMQSLLKTLLELEGFDAIIADMINETSLDSIKKTKPDAVLMDVHLHNENGMDIVKQLRHVADLKHTKVLMASGMDLRFECIQAGADGFLMKPFNPDDLIIWMKQNT